MKIWQEAGLPDGLVSSVIGTGVEIGGPLTGHPGIKKVSFTGSMPVGEPVDRPGYYRRATVFADCNNSMQIVREDLFGPVLAVRTAGVLTTGKNSDNALFVAGEDGIYPAKN